MDYLAVALLVASVFEAFARIPELVRLYAKEGYFQDVVLSIGSITGNNEEDVEIIKSAVSEAQRDCVLKLALSTVYAIFFVAYLVGGYW